MYKIAGITTVAGTPITTRVYVYSRNTGDKLGETTSDSSGNWSVQLIAQEECFVVCLDPNKLDNALVFDYVTPVEA